MTRQAIGRATLIASKFHGRVIAVGCFGTGFREDQDRTSFTQVTHGQRQAALPDRSGVNSDVARRQADARMVDQVMCELGSIRSAVPGPSQAIRRQAAATMSPLFQLG